MLLNQLMRLSNKSMQDGQTYPSIAVDSQEDGQDCPFYSLIALASWSSSPRPP